MDRGASDLGVRGVATLLEDDAGGRGPQTMLMELLRQQLLPLLDSIIPIRSRRGRPRKRPAKLHADKAYDIPALRAEVRRRGIAVRIARKGVEFSQRLGRHRWIVESCLSWLTRNRRLVRRYDRHADHFQAFADLGCALISYRRWTKATK